MHHNSCINATLACLIRHVGEYDKKNKGQDVDAFVDKLLMQLGVPSRLGLMDNEDVGGGSGRSVLDSMDDDEEDDDYEYDEDEVDEVDDEVHEVDEADDDMDAEMIHVMDILRDEMHETVVSALESVRTAPTPTVFVFHRSGCKGCEQFMENIYPMLEGPFQFMPVNQTEEHAKHVFEFFKKPLYEKLGISHVPSVHKVEIRRVMRDKVERDVLFTHPQCAYLTQSDDDLISVLHKLPLDHELMCL